MTGPVTIDASVRGYGALMQTLIGNRPANGGAYAGRNVQQVRDEQIAIAQRAEIHVGLSDDQLRELAEDAERRQNAAKAGSKAGA